MQQELPGHVVLKVNYVGRLGRRLLADADASQVIDVPDYTGQSTQSMSGTFAGLTVWRQAIFRSATTKIPDTCCNFFLSSLVSLQLAVPKRRPCHSPFCAVRVYSCSRMFQNEAGQ